MQSVGILFQQACAHHAAGRIDQAIRWFESVLTTYPNHVPTLRVLGLVEIQRGRTAEGWGYVKRALELAPIDGLVAHAAGVAQQAMGRHAEATEYFRRAVAARPELMESQIALGRSLARSVGPEAAIEHLSALVTTLGDKCPAVAYADLGGFLCVAERFAEGEAAARRAVALDPRSAQAYIALGGALHGLRRRQEALEAFRVAVQLAPGHHDALMNLAGELTDLDQLDEAMRVVTRAIELHPQSPVGYYNLTRVHMNLNQVAEASAAARRALGLRPHYPLAGLLYACSLLKRADFDRGWPEIAQWMRFTGDAGAVVQLPAPKWDGGAMPDKTLLITADWGFGDFIQFVRYVPLVAQRVGRVILQAPSELIGLIRNMPGPAEVIAKGQALPAFDGYVSVLELPKVLRTTLETIPGQVPYLAADEEAVAHCRARVCEMAGDALKVGLSWAGRPEHPNDHRRSAHIDDLAPLGAVEGVRFFSLQKGPAAAQLGANGPEGLRPVDLSADLPTFADTAAAMTALDLVISVDTAIVHLAGALARPTWTLLAFASEWRWLMDRDDSPWYPTMRLFRQAAHGDWRSAMVKAAAALKEFVRAHSPSERR